ncbi:MAG: hypothetical protein ACREBW_05795 [Candidatus Micrarchaeaceae archaeon]
MITKTFSKLAAFAAMSLLIGGAFLSATNARAQCPPCTCPPPPIDDYNHDTTTIPWQDSSVCVNIDGCEVKICYIYRQTSPGQFDYGIDQICWWATCATDSATLLKDASHWLMNNNPSHFPCPTCPSSDIEWNENFISCWQYYFYIDLATDSVVKVLTPCPQHGWCINGYLVCCDKTGEHFTLITQATKPCPEGQQGCIDLGQTLCPAILPR